MRRDRSGGTIRRLRAHGHCLQNRSAHDAVVLEIGSRVADSAGHYSDIDMIAPAGVKFRYNP